MAERSPLSVHLPDGASLLNVFVNGQSVALVRESEAYLFHVFFKGRLTTRRCRLQLRVLRAAIAVFRGSHQPATKHPFTKIHPASHLAQQLHSNPSLWRLRLAKEGEGPAHRSG